MKKFKINRKDAEIFITAMDKLAQETNGFTNLDHKTENFMCSLHMEIEEFLLSK